MGEKEFEAEEAASVDSLQQSLSLEEIFNRHNKSSSGDDGGRPFLIRVEEAHQGVHRGPKINAFEGEEVHSPRPRAPTPESGQKKKARPRRLGFSLFNLCRSGRRDRDRNTQEKGVVLALTQVANTLTGIEHDENSHTNATNLRLFQCVNTPATKASADLVSLRSLSRTPELVPLSEDSAAVQDLPDLSSIYTILNTRDKGIGDFTSVTFEAEDLGVAHYGSLSRPNTQEQKIKPQLLRPLTRDGGRPPTGEGKTLFVTSTRLPGHFLPPLAGREPCVVDADGDLSHTLESWMTHLPPTLQRIPLNHLFIPGSHDSFSYSLSPEEEVGPDVPRMVSRIASCIPCLARPAIMRWSVTQRATVTDQLNHGIRYFDIRVAVRASRFYFVHGLFGEDLKLVLSEIRLFLMEHPREVVLLDFQHFHGLSSNDHLALIALVKKLFTDLICPVSNKLQHLTLAYLARFKYQVLVFYRHTHTLKAVSWLWSSASLPNPWPDATSIDNMLAFLAEKLRARDPNKFFVTQCVLTPSGSYLVRNLFGKLERRMAGPTNKVLPDWIKDLPCCSPGANVIMTDFVDQDDWAVPRAVIDKNSVDLVSTLEKPRY